MFNMGYGRLSKFKGMNKCPTFCDAKDWNTWMKYRLNG